MAQEKITPEEKLLKIIESPATAPSLKLNRDTLGKKINALSFKKWIGKLKDIKSAINTIKNLINLRLVNKVFVGFCGLLTLVWIFDFISGYNQFAHRIVSIGKILTESEEKKEIQPDITLKLENVVSESRKRNIFTSLPTKATAEPSAGVTEAMSKLKLVGIIWSETPQTMIEDTKDQKTYLLMEGEQIGKIKIKKIFRNKVVVGYEDQESELR